MHSRLTVPLLFLNLGALFLAGWFVVSAVSESASPTVEDEAPAAPPPSPMVKASASDSLSRSPLFTPARKPPPPPAPQATEVVPIAPPRLVGIVASSRTPRALLETTGGDARRLVEAGGEFDGWIVTAVGRTSVTMKRGIASDPAQEELTLLLRPTTAHAGQPQ